MLKFCLVLVAAFGTQAALAQERPAAFVDAATVVPGLIVEMRYAGAHNFVGRPIDGYEAPRCLLTKAAANALAGVAKDVAAYGLVVKVFDCYRPTRAVANFVRWARDLNDTTGKAEFYPDVDKRTLFRDGYIASQSGHSRGSTVDLSLAYADGRELDMGTPFDFFSTTSWANSAGVSHDAQVNRSELAFAMRHNGFRPYEREWWHFTLRGEPFPETYFDFPVR
jgi:D-alanyl-D-alanine dipeptidase